MTVALDPIASNALTIANYLENHDVSALHPEAVFVDVTSGLRWQGRDAIAGMLAYLYEVAFDAHIEEPRLIVGLDAAVVEATFVGRHKAEFAGVPGSGVVVRVPLVVIYDVSDAQITGARIHFSVASLIAQAASAAGIAAA